MQVLNNKIVRNYIIPIILIPIIAVLLTIILKFTFNLGTYLGTFMRGLYELVLRNF